MMAHPSTHRYGSHSKLTHKASAIAVVWWCSLFFRHSFCNPNPCSTLFLFLGKHTKAEQKNQKQRAAPTQQRQKTMPEKQPGAKLHNVAL